MGVLVNFDLLSVGIAIAANLVIGFAAFFTNRKSATNKLFLLQTIILSIWSIVSYISYQSHEVPTALMLVRLVLFFAVPNSVIFLVFMHTFPSEKLKMTKKTIMSLVIVTVVVMAITLSPLLFSGVVVNQDSAPTPIVGFGILPFIALAILSIPTGIYYLIRNYIRASVTEKGQFKFLLIGVVIMFSLIVLFDFIFPSFLQNSRFVSLSALFTFPFVIFTSYAVYKHKLFNIKVFSIAFVAFILTIFSFFNILYAADSSQIVINITFFASILLGSIILIKSILKEIEQREKIQALATQLENLVHFVSHEVKGALGKSHVTFAEILEGDYGEASKQMKDFVTQADSDTVKSIDMVMNILRSADFKNGKLKPQMEIFDFRQSVIESVENAKREAEAKNLKLIINISEGEVYNIFGDKELISKHVIKNLIDNSINYTLSGEIKINLVKKMKKVLFSIQDTGVGITTDDMKNLFTEGGKGKDSTKVNVHSTGYGLYFAKSIVDANNGKIWAESKGVGTGSSFFVEFDNVDKKDASKVSGK